MKWAGALLLLNLAALAANPALHHDVRTELRAAQHAVRLGDTERAKSIYAAIDTRTDDPGLVAFNSGILKFRENQFREAEILFQRCLDDRDATVERRTKAWFNRGTCLIKIGGMGPLRAAIECLQRAAKSADGDSDFGRDIAHNLELAKLLWLDARAASASKPLPNEPPSEVPPESTKPETAAEPAKPNAEPNPNGTETTPKPQAVDPSLGAPKAQTGSNTSKTVAGKGNLPVTNEWAGWRPDTEADARDYLRELGRRLARDRRNLIETTAPPEPPRVKNW